MEKNLKEIVLENSMSQIWEKAVFEWEISGFDIDYDMSSICICGHAGIKYLYQITNSETGAVLYPVGSSCIKKFGVDALSEQTDTIEMLYGLLEKVENKEWIDIKLDFTRKLISYLHDEEIIYYDDDYEFLLKMFNKRNILTDGQTKKVSAILLNEIIPQAKLWIAKHSPKIEDDFALIIAGSRTFTDYKLFSLVTNKMLSTLKIPVVIFTGEAQGTDRLAIRYAKEHNMKTKVFSPEWNRYGRCAGYVSNEEKHDESIKYSHRGCLCFWNGSSPGTEHNFDLARKRNTELKIWNYTMNKWDYNH